jgi:hypothetical protein
MTYGQIASLKDEPNMAIAIPSGLTDDNDFVALLNLLLNRLLVETIPEQLWAIQIDNWFDHKWLRYSGNGIVASKLFPPNWEFSLFDRFASVKAEFWRDKLTFPPFAPSRVVNQWSFVRLNQDYIEAPLPKLPHKQARRRSYSNLNRRVEDFAVSASYVWYSGNTLKNGRASVMVYRIAASRPICWFAALRRDSSWTLEGTKGIEKDHVSRLLIG